jgi:hypothetical protein
MNVLTFELTDDQAEALAQFVKRVSWYDWRQNAVDDDEAHKMRSAFDQLQKALWRAGFNPR